MHPLPVIAKHRCRFRLHVVVGGQHEAWAGSVAEEASAMNLTCSRKSDRVFGKFDRNHPVDPIVGQPSDVHDLVLRIDLFLASLVAVLVANTPVLDSLRLHSARMKRPEFCREARVTRNEEVVRVTPQSEPKNLLLSPLERCLPRVRGSVQPSIQRMLASRGLASGWKKLVKMQRECRDGFRKDSRAGQNGSAKK